MAISQINSVVHLCEDTSQQFDLLGILAAAGYTATLPISITQMYVLNAAGVPDTTVPAGLFTKVDADTVKVDATLYPDRNFSFNTLTILLDAGPNQVLVNLQVIVDPVNDAPTAEDHTITLTSAAGYVIKESDFGFADPHDATPANQANPAGNNFASVVITGLPPTGSLLLNGVAVAFGAEISIAEIRAGHLVYQPNATFGGQTAFGFEVRDDGGTAGCGASDLSLIHHMVFDIPNAMLGDRVWIDSNGNGVQDNGETGAAGLTVSLKGAGADGVFGTADDVVLKTTTTDANGKYLFDHLTAGQYQVQFTTAAGYTFTGKDLGGNDATDSDASATGLSQVVTLGANEANLTVDAGLLQTCTSSLGDRVWYDTNKNGVQDSGETGAAGLAVSLKGAGADGVFGTADDVTLRTTTTSSTGNYLFSGLAAGQYQVQFTTAAGYTFTGKDLGGNDATDSDANVTTGRSQVVTLGVGEANLTVDAGLAAVAVCTSSLGDRVWYDTNNNGVQDSTEVGAAGQTVLLRGAGADGLFGTSDDVTLASTTTDANGKYLFSGLAAGQYQVKFFAATNYGFTGQDLGGNDSTDSDANASTGLSQVVTLAANQANLTVDAGLVCRTASIGDRVWVDSIANGVQDSGEVGMSGVFVSLRTAGADGVFGTADDVVQRTTTTDTNGNYLFDHLAAGQYQVTFTRPTGYSFTAQDYGNDATDSDVNENGVSQVVTLVNGQANMTVDAGLLSNAMLGDRIWYDTNGNGIQDTGETGVAGVTVQLRAAGTDGVLGTADDVYRSTTTNASGNYVFGYLTPGTLYQVGVVTSSLPTGYQLTKQDAGTNDSADSDANVTTGWMQSVRLAAGEQNMSFDAGVVKCVPTACASIVGASGIYEGTSAYYSVHLSQAVTADTYVWVSAIDGTAKRTTNYAPDQTISAGGYCDDNTGTRYYNMYWDATGTSLLTATGPSDQSWDYSIYDTGGNRIGSSGGFYALVSAGKTDSNVFEVVAYQETVYADRNAFPNLSAGWWQEAAWENFTLNLSCSSNSNVTICQPNTTVSIGDTSCYTVVSPIALDLDGNGIHSTALIDSQGKFDMGSGTPVNSGWLSSGDGFLAVDSNGNGKIDDITELFGGNKGDGFAKLASYDSNHDGFVDAKDADFAKLLVWQDLNGNHQTDAGELRSLAQAGIASLTVAFTDQSINQLGNVLGETSTATRADGSSIEMTDVYFNIAAQDAGDIGALPPQVSPPIAQLLDGGNTLLDQAFGSQAGITKTIDPVTTHHAALDGGDTLRHLLSVWNSHTGHANQMAY
ncbi:hypothetical protein BH11PSE8_BH11PSE8_00740 [soil metagenome]